MFKPTNITYVKLKKQTPKALMVRIFLACLRKSHLHTKVVPEKNSLLLINFGNGSK